MRPNTGASMHKRAYSVPAANASAAHMPTRPGTAASVHSRTASAAAGQPNPPTDAHYAAAPSDPASLTYNKIFKFPEQLQQQNEQRAPVGPARKLASAAPALQQSVPQQTTRHAALQQLRSLRLQHAGGGEQAASGSAAAATAQVEVVMARGLTRRAERSASVSTQAHRKVRPFLGACVGWGTHAYSNAVGTLLMIHASCISCKVLTSVRTLVELNCNVDHKMIQSADQTASCIAIKSESHRQHAFDKHIHSPLQWPAGGCSGRFKVRAAQRGRHR